MDNFQAIGQLVIKAQDLLDSIKAGAIRAMQTEFEALKSSFQSFMNLSQQTFDNFVTTQRGRVAAVLEHFDNSTSYMHSYHSGFPVAADGDGNYHIVQLSVVKDYVTSLSPMISLAFHGNSCVGSAIFMSLAQTHAHYTGQKALMYTQGNPEVRYFVDRTDQRNAPVYVAVKNTNNDSANVEIKASSNSALDFKFFGTVSTIPADWEEIHKVNV